MLLRRRLAIALPPRLERSAASWKPAICSRALEANPGIARPINLNVEAWGGAAPLQNFSRGPAGALA
jgi:hypothetical protein